VIFAIRDSMSLSICIFCFSVVLWLNGLDFIFAEDCVVDMDPIFDEKKLRQHLITDSNLIVKIVQRQYLTDVF
jgi:hypothetical protein